MGLARSAALVAIASLMTGCGAHGASGTYVAHGQGFVEMLQLTQTDNGQVMGSLQNTTLKPDGSITHTMANVSGVANGGTLMLAVKNTEPFSTSVNFAATISGGTLTLTTPTGPEPYTEASPSDYQAAAQALSAQAAVVQKQRAEAEQQQEAQQQAQAAERERENTINELDNEAGALAATLEGYTNRITTHSEQNRQAAAKFHATHAAALAKMRHGLEVEHRYPAGSLQASQVDLAVDQVATSLENFDDGWQNQFIDIAREHISELDGDIQRSVCKRNDVTLSNCATRVPQAIAAYQPVRTTMLGEVADIASTIATDKNTADALVHEADDYAAGRN